MDSDSDLLASSSNLSELDFESEKFDPEAVLRAEINSVVIPDPKAKTYNHLDEYERKSGAKQLGLLGEIQKDALASDQSKAVTTKNDNVIKFNKKDREEELKKTLTPVVRSKRDQKSVINTMNTDVSGPLAFLFKCINRRVRVVIRRRKIVFQNHDQTAYLFGNLVAFDKHYNLILSDVIEKVKLKPNANDDGDCDQDLPQNKRRNFKTIFIRGSNVIFVSLETSTQDPEAVSSTSGQQSKSEIES